MSKAGSSRLRTTLIRAADTARKQYPQLARIYHTQMVDRSAEHLKALYVVGGALAVDDRDRVADPVTRAGAGQNNEVLTC